MSTDRMRRVNEAVKEVLSSRISEGFNDPRIGFVTVTAVDTSPDLRHARVHVSVLGSEVEREQTLAGLGAAHGLLQQAIARELRMKRTPTLSFSYDDSIDRGMRISELLEDEVHPEQRAERVPVGVLMRREQQLLGLAQLGQHLVLFRRDRHSSSSSVMRMPRSIDSS